MHRCHLFYSFKFDRQDVIDKQIQPIIILNRYSVINESHGHLIDNTMSVPTQKRRQDLLIRRLQQRRA